MPSDFEVAFNTLAAPIMQDYFGVTVCLARGSFVTAEFVARRSDREHKALGQEYGLEIEVTMRDFILPASALVIQGDTTEPQTGDRIVEGEEIFEVMPPDDVKPSVELQTGGYEWLVHTKRVK